MKSILICIPNLNVLGGTEVQTLTLSKVLKRNGFIVSVCCYFLHDEDLLAEFRREGIEVHCLNLRTKKPVQFISNLVLLIRKIKPNIVHVQYIAPGLLPIVACRIARVETTIAAVHQPFNEVLPRRSKDMLRIGAFLCNAFICVSLNAEKSWFGSSLLFKPLNWDTRRKHFTVYNGIDTGFFSREMNASQKQEVRNKFGLLDEPTVGIVAGLRHEKGHRLLFRAFSKVLKHMPEARLVIVGDGPDRKKLECLAIDLNINKQIYWFGQSSFLEVAHILKCLDVVAVPSQYEGFGLSAVEAMCSGLPVVATRTGSMPEIIENGVTGYLVSAGEADAFADAIIMLLRDRELAKKIGMESRVTVRDRFSLSTFEKFMLAVYDLYGISGSR